jgi:guanylate kinase
MIQKIQLPLSSENSLNDTDMGKFIILAGPSGVGKGPLTETLFTYMRSTGKRISKHVLYTDRAMRPGEKNGKTYHFISTEDLRKRTDPGHFTTFTVRGSEQLQGVDIDKLNEQLARHDFVFLEIFHEQIPAVAQLHSTVECVFLTPLSEQDFDDLKCGQNPELREIAIRAVMQTKLANRNTESPARIAVRAASAFDEITNYTGASETVLTNHYGEDVAPLWKKLQRRIKSRGGLDAALNDPRLKYIAETFDSFLNLIGCPRKKNPFCNWAFYRFINCFRSFRN